MGREEPQDPVAAGRGQLGDAAIGRRHDVDGRRHADDGAALLEQLEVVSDHRPGESDRQRPIDVEAGPAQHGAPTGELEHVGAPRGILVGEHTGVGGGVAGPRAGDPLDQRTTIHVGSVAPLVSPWCGFLHAGSPILEPPGR